MDLYRQAPESRRMGADLNTLENSHGQMQNLSLYSKFSLEIDWETSRSRKSLPMVKSSLFTREVSVIYRRITHFQIIHNLITLQDPVKTRIFRH